MVHTVVYLSTSALLLTGWWLLIGGEGRPSPLSRLLGAPDTRVHVWSGWVLTAALVAPLLLWPGTVRRFLAETFRTDPGDARWWRSWPAGALRGRFARHEGHFDPGQRVANVALLGGLAVLVGTGLAMGVLHGGPLFSVLARVHKWTAIAITPVIAGHLAIALGVLPGYRGVWRSAHLGGRVDRRTALRLWPGWAERADPQCEGSQRPEAADRAEAAPRR